MIGFDKESKGAIFMLFLCSPLYASDLLGEEVHESKS